MQPPLPPWNPYVLSTPGGAASGLSIHYRVQGRAVHTRRGRHAAVYTRLCAGTGRHRGVCAPQASRESVRPVFSLCPPHSYADETALPSGPMKALTAPESPLSFSRGDTIVPPTSNAPKMPRRPLCKIFIQISSLFILTKHTCVPMPCFRIKMCLPWANTRAFVKS